MAIKYGYILNEDGTTTPQADPGAVQRGETVPLAEDSNKLGGKADSDFLLQTDVLTLEEIQASTDLTGKVLSAESEKIVDITDEITISDASKGTYVTHKAYRVGANVMLEVRTKPIGDISPGNEAVKMYISKYLPLTRTVAFNGYGGRIYYGRLEESGAIVIEPLVVNSVSGDTIVLCFVYITGESI